MASLTDQPLVSIITPSFNQGAFIAQTIESVLSQDYPHIEYLVVDGGSRDTTLDVLRRYDRRIRWISEPDGGQADAINKGVTLTSGPIVAWLNSDDVYAPGAVSRAVRELQAYPATALVYGQAEFIDDEATVMGPCSHVESFDLDRLIHNADFIVQPAAFFSRETLVAVGGLNTSLHYCFDYDLWIRFGKCRSVRYVPSVLARARVHPETKTANGGLERMDEIERMIQAHGRALLPSHFYCEMLQECGHAGRQALAAGDWGTAWSCVRRGAVYGLALALAPIGSPRRSSRPTPVRDRLMGSQIQQGAP